MELADHPTLAPGIANPEQPQSLALVETTGTPTRAVSLADMSNDALLSALYEMEQIEIAIRKELEPLLANQSAIRREIQNRMNQKGAVLLASPFGKVELVAGKKTYEKDESVLSQLKALAEAGEIGADDFAKFYQEETKIKVDLRARGRVEKYGDKVRAILERGIREVPGTPVFTITWNQAALEGEVA